MTELLTAAQMRTIERAAIDSGEVAGLELMERAGRGVVEAIFEEWPELAKTSHRAVVLCGPGNNGGDGFVVARLLKEWGWEVEVFLYGDPEKLPPDARLNHKRWSNLGPVSVRAINPPPLVDDSLRVLDSTHLVVDALFGTGLIRPFVGLFTTFADALVQNAMHAKNVRTVAVDVPTGICSDSGRVLGTAIPANLTVTFHRAKLGHFLSKGPEISGRLVVKDIGLPSSRRAARGTLTPRRESDAGLAPVRLSHAHGPDRLPKSSTHKYTHGHALILSGPATRTGAARLAARGALRIGAGLVTVAAPAPALAEHAAQLTAIMLREANVAADLTHLLEDERLNALCLGPGMGVGETTRDMVKAALNARRATVLDADALMAFEETRDALFTLLHANCVLTPHGGEFARLFPDISQRLGEPTTCGPAYSKVDATREAAARAGCTVLFKGRDTVIADAQGNCRINSSAYDRAAPWLATAGSGDVLAGFITGLLARGFSPFEAASTAAWLHTECALSFGPGLIAEDLPEVLPKVFKALGL